ncbi:autotransporter outer membrane beta-barrel domain-containing protein [Mycobacterium sp. KBS0706]|uniref:autotransporter outer membrane beta-barrel domain-containing protein n=1 Tax=Mycobacterium sp. KBS0706 TaxID=2578109 RepID=UPI00110FF643|nr:autotransporter outer membrane beta-barrel domain-containing protein [Mycobacterium sp. KBS0706]TSD90205.1 autotransporter outer membrane beta-barrel domain-containing protein [Mycobacterium sp. KBS0706]
MRTKFDRDIVRPASAEPAAAVTRPAGRAHALWPRLALLSSVSAAGLLAAVPGHAGEIGCSGSNPATCNISSGSYSQRDYVLITGAAGDDDVKTGGASDSLSVTNSGTFNFGTLTTTLFPLFAGITAATVGGTGKDEGGGGNAGSLTFTNNGAVTANLITTNFPPVLFLIHAVSSGGEGDQDNKNDNSDGGTGGTGGTVTFTNNQQLNVTGTSEGFIGIFAESAGGRGGEQNSAVIDDQKGGAGGAGGSATATNNSTILFGSSSNRLQGLADGGGMIASSLGGAGGNYNGNAGSAGSATATNNGSVQIYWNANGGDEVFGIAALSAGGEGIVSTDNSDNGGNGGGSGTATANNAGQILVDVTNGTSVVGAALAAESRGGDGGTGPKEDHSGGNGGTAGNAAANLIGSGMLTTHGNSLYGILAESLGGQGGDGGDGTALAGTGGGGGFGGNAGNVTVTTAAGSLITTTGTYAGGIVAHSIGGGGGTGSDFQSVLGGAGGNGGNGGNGGTATVTSAGTISTTGDHAYGVLSQSIAGSGGTGGVATGEFVALGGDGAGGGTAGEAIIRNSGGITTGGYSSHGIIAQSIGGGGGAAGSATGLVSVGGDAAGTTDSDGGKVLVNNTGTVTTAGDAAVGLVAQSVGGGGGSGGDSKGIAGVGGSGSAGGDGGEVDLINLGRIQTTGDFGHGVLAQSVGGGGGNGGDVLTVSTIASIGIGGNAANGGDGGTVCVDNTGTICSDGSGPAGQAATITTTGNYAVGLMAQSVGGGGGNGGSVQNYSALSFVALQIGGKGGDGGIGKGATVQQNDLTLTTGGAHAIGVLAQSVGGGGGNGGDASYYNVTLGFNASLVVGGSGGSGGTGGGAATVALNNSRIMTGLPPSNVDPETYAPDDAFGVVAQSVGGGGGNGGSSSAADLVVAAPTGTGVPVAFNFQGAVGGTGGSAGAGGAASVSLTGGSSVTTVGDGSHAVVAQSVGGGGGNGGDASVLSTTLGDKDTVEVTAGMSLGGSASTSASTGGTVTVTLGDASGPVVGSPPALQLPPTQPTPASTIVTYGNYADGVLAQSIGGGGGNGGIGASNAYSQGGVVSVKATVGLGGTGGSGGTVNMTQYQNQTIQTLGSGSRGIVAQSIGGGGGNSQGGTLFLAAGAGGYEGRLTVGVGRTGGSGGDGGAVTASTAGAISTVGGDADGVMLQSIGGGGGLGGSIGADASSHPILDRIGEFKDNKDRLSDEGNTYTLSVDVGGTGGGGGNGGAVSLTHSGRIATAGDWADGIVAQSIGGGGGAGGSATASGSKVQANITVGVGGKGGSAATGGTVSAIFDDSYNNQANTSGYAANAVVLQSIGGGGGQGGDGSDQAAGNLTVGGDGGGTGGGGGDGGTVQINPLVDGRGSWLNAMTSGDDAIGILAQSIGGGGGTGGAGNSSAAKNIGGHAVAVVVGGKGGVSGNGEAVTLTTGLALNTFGARSYGVVAQSIGGGGGIGGAGAANNLVGLALGGQSGAGGSGGAVTVDITTESHITTGGAGAHAIVAQSIGGGGGIGGDASVGLFSLNPAGRSGAGGGNGGNGGTVAVTVDGSINTSGANAFGILAQSIGGGGGFGGDQSGAFAGSTGSSGSGVGGAVTVTQSGTISTTGANSVGIFAQSEGPQGDGKVTVTVNGTVTGGSGQGAGVWVAGGVDNVMTVNANGRISATSGTAIHFVGDSTGSLGSVLDVTNYGTISGNILLVNSNDTCNGTGGYTVQCLAGTVNNYSSDTLVDASLYVADVNNQGRLVVGHSGAVDGTEIVGDFTQGAAGTLVVDTDFNRSAADRLLVRGDAALGGMLDLQATSLRPGRALTVLTVDGAATGAITPEVSPIYRFALAPQGHDYRLSVASADFDAEAMKLEGNQSKVARGLQEIWDAGGTDGFGTLFATLGAAADQGSKAYSGMLSDLSPGVALAPAAQLQAGLARFNSGLMSCPVFSGADALTSETECAWAQVTGRSTQQTADSGTSGFSDDSITYQVGGQHEVAPGWLVGMSAAYQNSWLDGYDGRVDGDGDSGYLGLTVKREIGPWQIAGALSGSYGSFELNRRVSIPGFAGTASSDPDVFAGSARLRVARTFAVSEMYLKPYLDLDAIYSRMPGYREDGGGDLGLKVEDSDQFTFAFSPTIEVGGRVAAGNAVLRPYAYAGVSILTDDDWTAKARFAGAPSGTGSFDTSLPIDDVVARIGAGVQVLTAAGVDFRFQYDGEFSDRTSSNAGSLKAILPF